MLRYLNPAPRGEWWDYSWNPVTGCRRNCSYCYAKKLAWRFGKTETERNFEPAFHPDRLLVRFDLLRPSRIFVCSNSDLFLYMNRFPPFIVNTILEVCRLFPQHRFLFLTKNPIRYNEFIFPDNCWTGTTVTQESDIEEIFKFGYKAKNTFVSFEPLIGPTNGIWNYFEAMCLFWIIVGAQTPRSPRTNPESKWVKEIIDFAYEYDIPLFLKSNLCWPEKIQQFPEGLKKD